MELIRGFRFNYIFLTVGEIFSSATADANLASDLLLPKCYYLMYSEAIFRNLSFQPFLMQHLIANWYYRYG